MQDMKTSELYFNGFLIYKTIQLTKHVFKILKTFLGKYFLS